jgi:hypothetical protein
MSSGIDDGEVRVAPSLVDRRVLELIFFFSNDEFKISVASSNDGSEARAMPIYDTQIKVWYIRKRADSLF